MARIFTNALRSVIVSRRQRRLSQKHAEQILCVSVSSVCNDSWHKNLFLTQRLKVSQSLCVVLRSLLAIFSHRNPRKTQNSPRIFGYLQVFFEPLMARIFTNALRSGMVSHKIHGRHRIPSERICLTQTAQIFADNVYLSTLHRLHGWVLGGVSKIVKISETAYEMYLVLKIIAVR